MKQQWLKVVDSKGFVREQWDVIVHNNGERYSVLTPRRTKHYKTLKSVEKFLNEYNLKIA